MTSEQSRLVTVDDLLQQGLDLYGRNLVEEAICCWQEALALAPDDRRARDLLEGAGAAPPSSQRSGVVISLHPERRGPANQAAQRTATPPIRAAVEPIDRQALEALLKEKRFEEALDFLYAQREASPDDASVSRGIRAIKEHLILRYGRELGSLDRVPMRGRASDETTLPPEQRHVLRLVDALASFGDVIRSSQLGRFETYRVLCRMLKAGLISARAPSVVMPAVRPPPPELDAPASEAPLTRPSQHALPAAAEASPETPPSTPPPSTEARFSGPPSWLAPAPPSSTTVGEAVLGGDGDEYDQCFALATEAYLCRDFAEAARLYRACLALRPDDARAAHNLQKLAEMHPAAR
jgi:tetratricopeptide (TPR) repeat protein